MTPLHFSSQIEEGRSKPTQILSEMHKGLQDVLQAMLELANTSMQKSKDKLTSENGIYDTVNFNMYGHV